jgi:hypothetical protein
MPSLRGAILVFAMAMALAGCAGFVPQEGPPPEPPSLRGSYLTLTTPFIAVGDSQEHLSTGYPAARQRQRGRCLCRGGATAARAGAVRPPRLLEWALQRYPDEPYVHLGDVMDLSCRIEAERMTRIFRATGRPGAILPGNHDGLMFGIYGYNVLMMLDPTPTASGGTRPAGAAQPGRSAQQDHQRGLQQARLHQPVPRRTRQGMQAEVPGLQAPPASGKQRVSWRNPNPDAFLSAIEARCSTASHYADSFIAQRLQAAARARRDARRHHHRAGHEPGRPLVSTWDTIMGRSPGSVGHIHPDQIRR